jgi:superfamily I DNA and RNA helicase
LRVIGAAGSGKTQLALRILEDAAAKGRRAQYVCFNRPLADHLARIAPATVKVTTFHVLGDQQMRAAAHPPNFGQPGVFAQLADACIRKQPAPDELLDVLVVDEGQDFSQSWADALLAWLKPDGKAWWLEDPLQNRYDKPRFELPGWVTLHADVNYRTPREVLRQIGLFVDVGEHVKAGGPLQGDDIDIATYADFAGLKEATIRAIGKARSARLKSSDIAVLTYCGRERSVLMRFYQLGAHALRRFGGTYDDAGNPVFQEGDILVETVFRFKGQSAPCIILTEIDFEVLDERVARRFYVGATRARMQLALVTSDRAAAKLMERLE